MEGNWLDEDTDLKSAGRNCFGGSSPSPSAIFCSRGSIGTAVDL